MNPRYLYLTGFGITAGVICYYDIKNSNFPWPPRIIATGVVFTMLDLFSGFSPELSGVIGIGFMLAMIVNSKLQGGSQPNCPCVATASDFQVLPNAQAAQPAIEA